MDAAVAVAADVAAEQAEELAGVAAGVLDFVAQEEVAAANPVAVDVFGDRCQRFADFGGELRRDPLIGVEDEHPLVRSPAGSPNS